MYELGLPTATSWVPVASVVRILGVSRQRVNKLAQEGKLSAQDFDGVKLISLRSVEQLIALRGNRKRGRSANR
jgi:hypothetical protein